MSAKFLFSPSPPGDTPALASAGDGEAEALARRLGPAVEARLKHARFRERVRAMQTNDPDPHPDEPVLGSLEVMTETPPEKLTWGQLAGHQLSAPEACAAKWEELRALARADLAGGGRLVEMVGRDTPWERARLLAVREALAEEWRPRGRAELTLLDQAALSFHAWGEWQGRAARLSREVDAAAPHVEGWPKGKPGPYDALDYEFARYETLVRREGRALETAAQYHRTFLRALRALRDLRRYNVTIHSHGGQVNIAEQQVNVKGEPLRDGG